MPIRVLPGSIEKIESHCNLCAMQCAFRLWVEPWTNEVIGVEGDESFPTTHGLMCVKGSHSYRQLAHPDRLRKPLLRDRRADAFREVSWEEAVAACAERIRGVQRAHGTDAMAVFGGGALTNETVYLLGKWARLALRTPNIDYNGRFCMSSAAVASNKAFGVDRGLPFPVADIAKADFILLVGANVADCLPPLMDTLKEAKAHGASIVTVDPRSTNTSRVADWNLAVQPGTDLALALALLHVLIRDRRINRTFIAERTRGFDETARSVAHCTPTWASDITGVPAALIEKTAAAFADAPNSLILSARGGEQQSKGVDTVLALINVALSSGKVGRPGCGFGTLTGQGNGQGGREHGQKADQLPGYRKIDNPRHRTEVAAVWGVDPASLPGPGLSAFEMLDAVASKKIRGLFVMGSNPAVSSPDVDRIAAGLSELEFLAVADFFPSETVSLAHVVFPTTLWAEESGTMTNIEGRVILREKALTEPEDVRPDWRILCDVARALGVERGFSFDSIEDLFNEFTRATRGGIADYGGLTYERLRKERGVPWPCPEPSHPGTPRLFEDGRFWHPDGKAVFHAVAYRAPAEESDAEFPWRLTTGRLLEHYLTGNQTHRIAPLAERHREPVATAHPDLARAAGVSDGETVRLVTRRGSMTLKIKTTDKIQADTIFVPFHWGGALSVNQLTHPALDPVSRMPEFKVCAVRLEKAAP